MNPDDLSFTVTWIGFWFYIADVTLNPTEVANAFFDTGSDVVISGIDTTEAVVEAGERVRQGERAFAIPYGNINGCSRGADACLGVAYYNWGPAYLDTINKVIDGTWEQSWDWLEPDWEDINAPDTSIIGYLNGDGLPEEVLEPLGMFYEEISAYMSDEANDGRIFLWEGPLNLQDGTELAAEGESVDLLDIWFVPQLLEGMTGASTSE
jgi:simple sugar transport system substrate-binding protein